MDYFLKFLKYACAAPRILVVVTLFGAGGAQALVADIPWSFEDHPHPATLDLTDEEFILLDHNIYGLERVEYCRSLMANGFEIYSGRYPDFKKSGEVDQRYRDWKRYIAKYNISGMGTCVYSLPFQEITQLELTHQIMEAGFRFCGHALPPPATELEARFKDLTDQLIDNALTGQIPAFARLLFTHDMKTTVFLNPDVEYFVRKSLERAEALEPADWNVDQLLPKLDADRIAFLDDALDRNDFAAVIATTPPCPAN